MENTQTYMCKSNLENTVSNNARSVDDCSSRGLCLQRKANAIQCNSNVMQRMAWVATKPLDKLYESSASSQSAPDEKRLPYEPLEWDGHSIGRGKAQVGKRKRLAYNMIDLQPHHRHFIFSPSVQNQAPDEHELAVQERISRVCDRSQGNVYNNIGYGCGKESIHGPGILFSENVFARGYTMKEQISNSPEQDDRLINAIYQKLPQNTSYKTYDLVRRNCQDWVEDVRNTAGL